MADLLGGLLSVYVGRRSEEDDVDESQHTAGHQRARTLSQHPRLL